MRTSDEWATPDLAAVARVLQDTTGLIFPPNRREPAEAGMRRAMAHLGVDAFDLRRAIAVPGIARDTLVTELTVGETFFFRESGQLDFLRDSVLPSLRDSIGDARPLRMWSAGSATGEEAYSLAMVLREAGWSWPASILGTDLVPARLAAARRGRYTHWSMRGVPEAAIDRYFVRQDKYFLVREDIRTSVEFRVLNLADDDYPSSSSGVGLMDVIFCRNVLIYFDKPNVESIVRRLLASLAPDGWLFLGASDPAIADLVQCEVVLTGAGLAYRPLPPGSVMSRRADLATPVSTLVVDNAVFEPFTPPTGFNTKSMDEVDYASPAIDTYTVPHDADEKPAVVEETSAVPARGFAELYDGGDYSAAASAARLAIEGGDTSERAWTLLIRSLANEGRLEAAGEAAAAALDYHGMSAEVSYLNGMLLAQSGRHADAAAAFKRSLYLDARFAIAHLALGDALFAVGDPAAARRAYSNAEAVLRTMGTDSVVSGADGLPVARLLHIARYHLQRLPDARTPVSRRGVA